MHHLTTAHLTVLARSLAMRLRDESGEGVISTAIAVLVLAFVGAGMWVGFNALMTSSCQATANELSGSIGGAVNC